MVDSARLGGSAAGREAGSRRVWIRSIVGWTWLTLLVVLAALSVLHSVPYAKFLLHPLGQPLRNAIVERPTALRVRNDLNGGLETWRLDEWTGVILFYASTCPICAENMANWLDIATVAVREHVPLVALTIADSTAHRHYWDMAGPWLGRFSVFDNSDLVKMIKSPITPTTILVRNGRVEGYFDGRLGRGDCRRIVEWMAGNAKAREWEKDAAM